MSLRSLDHDSQNSVILAPLGDGVGVVLAGPGVSDEKEEKEHREGGAAS